MFLNAFQTQPDQPVEQEDDSAGKWFAPEDNSGAALGGAKLGGPWGQPLHAPSVPSSPARPSLGEGKPVPGEFTQMFHKLEFAPAAPVSSAPEARPSPEISRQEPGDFTRMFVRATASMPQRPMPAGSDPAAFAPPAAPRLKGFSTPGVSDSASAEGSFTQLFQTPAPAPAAPVRPFTPLSNGTEAAWSSNLDSPPSKDAMESAGVTQLFRALSPENEPLAIASGNRARSRRVPSSSAPGSITMLIQRLTEEQSSAAFSPLPASGPEPARVSEPGEFTRIMSGGSARCPRRSGQSGGEGCRRDTSGLSHSRRPFTGRSGFLRTGGSRDRGSQASDSSDTSASGCGERGSPSEQAPADDADAVGFECVSAGGSDCSGGVPA